MIDNKLENYTEKQKSTDWKWTLENDYPQKNGLKAFSCFACGGGSTMGYKLAGIDVLGCNEIDPKMNAVYVKNHRPKYNYIEDIRDFNKREDLPKELYELDILDMSPPCSSFSIAGKREKDWGKEKRFREGQKLQTLDDLVFESINTIEKLQPKVAIIENVKGLLLGSAKNYVEEMYIRFEEIGYKAKHWLLKGEEMGVPQKRHRVFFVATRLDFDLEQLNMDFNYEEIPYKVIKAGVGRKPAEKALKLLENTLPTDTALSAANKRLYGKGSWFTHSLCREDYVMPTILAGHSCLWRMTEKEGCSKEDFVNGGTFPQDFDFNGLDVSYIVGMSVPPIMIKRVATRLIESGIFNLKK